jgi:hypothetical protein
LPISNRPQHRTAPPPSDLDMMAKRVFLKNEGL